MESSVTPAGLVEPSEALELAAGAATGALKPTQQVIRGILNGSAAETEQATVLPPLSSLMAMQVMPSSYFDIENGPKPFCFDIASPSPSWTAHSVCDRCRDLHRLMQGESLCGAKDWETDTESVEVSWYILDQDHR